MTKSKRKAELRRIGSKLVDFIDKLDGLRDAARKEFNGLADSDKNGPIGDSITDEIDLVESASVEVDAAATFLAQLIA